MSYFKDLDKTILDSPKILGIESSCDDCCASVVSIDGRRILSNKIITSAAQHVKFGGVVPEIASRAHTESISHAVDGALKEASLKLSDIDAVAVTYGAGLLGALLVGVSYAKALAYSINKPLVAVNHIRGHIAASYLGSNLEPPYINVLCSGGHTAIILVKDYYTHEVLGSTLDDAVGEAFDKVARVLSLPYPGGPNIEKLAREGKDTVVFPKMLKGRDTYDFSYSGLKTAVINYIHNCEQKGEEYSRADVAASFQKAAVDVLVERAMRAAKEYGITTVSAGGGVAANGYLREKLSVSAAKRKIKLYLPEKALCTDNAAMIAAEGYLQYKKGNFADMDLNAHAFIAL